MGLGYNSYLDGFRVCCTLKRSTHVRTRSSAEVRGPGQGVHCTVWMSLAALVLEMTCYSGSPLQTEPGFFLLTTGAAVRQRDCDVFDFPQAHVNAHLYVLLFQPRASTKGPDGTSVRTC